jgi:hypothetical protein
MSWLSWLGWIAWWLFWLGVPLVILVAAILGK